MLKLFESIHGKSVLSLRTGQPVATIGAPIINPNNLYIEGWHASDNRSGHALILLSQDVREVIEQGFVVNDHEVLSDEAELIRLKDVIKIGFGLVDIRVATTSGKNLGKASDFALETSSFFIKKIYVAQSLVKNFSGGTLSIDRSQIVEITNNRIIIEDPTEKVRSNAPAPVPAV